MNKNVRDKSEKWETSSFVKGQESIIGNNLDHPFSTGELQKSIIFHVLEHQFCQGGAPATPLNAATLLGSCYLKTTLVVFVAKNC